jgi:hypothetical protein
MKLEGTNALHGALEARYGELDPQPTYEANGRTLTSRGAWRCPVCCRGERDPYRLTVALDEDGDPPRCSNGCTEEAIWRALGHDPASYEKRTPSVEPSRKRTRSTAEKRTEETRDTQRDAHRDEKRYEENISKGVISLDISKGVISLDISKGAGEIAELGVADECAEHAALGVGTSRNEARARALGVPTALEADFRCIIPGHEHHAQLTATARGHWVYRCADHPALSLADLRAALSTGEPRRLSKIGACRWLERLDYEAQLRAPRPVAIEPRDGWTTATRKVATGLSLFLGLRDERMAAEPFVFARVFIIAYCGVTNEQARRAMAALERDRIIERVGESHRAILWRLVEEPS